MCGRYILKGISEEAKKELGIQDIPFIPPLYNIAPGQNILAVLNDPETSKRGLIPLYWGLIPSWVKNPEDSHRHINARSETAADKASFKDALRYRRCLIPATGFYEWSKQDGGKQPYFIGLKKEATFAFAGIWEDWLGPNGECMLSCAILTTTPNSLVRKIHSRMPCILKPNQYDNWINTNIHKPEDIKHLLSPYPAEEMQAYRVTTYVNNPANNDEKCLEAMKTELGL